MTTPNQPDLHTVARLITISLYYDLPGDKGEAYWTNTLANLLGIFRSQCISKQVADTELSIRIRKRARLLRQFLGLTDYSPYPRLSSLAMLEGSLCDVVGASLPVRLELMGYHQLITSNMIDQALNDTLGFDDDWELPCVCESTPDEEVDLRVYHTLFQQ